MAKINLSHAIFRQYNFDLYNEQACVSIENCGPNLSMLDFGFNYQSFDEMNPVYQIPASDQVLVRFFVILHIFTLV